MKLRVCTFYFENGTTVSAAIDPINHKAKPDESAWKPFQQMLEDAKEKCWQGDEERGRGHCIKFETLGFITV